MGILGPPPRRRSRGCHEERMSATSYRVREQNRQPRTRPTCFLHSQGTGGTLPKSLSVCAFCASVCGCQNRAFGILRTRVLSSSKSRRAAKDAGKAGPEWANKQTLTRITLWLFVMLAFLLPAEPALIHRGLAEGFLTIGRSADRHPRRICDSARSLELETDQHVGWTPGRDSQTVLGDREHETIVWPSARCKPVEISSLGGEPPLRDPTTASLGMGKGQFREGSAGVLGAC